MGALCGSNLNRKKLSKSSTQMRPITPNMCDVDDNSDSDIGKGSMFTPNPLLFRPKALTHKFKKNDDYRTHLINAYIHSIHTQMTDHTIIPNVIHQIILQYYPLYQVYGIGHNLINFKSSEPPQTKFHRFPTIENILPHSHCLYSLNNEYIIQNQDIIYEMSLLYDYQNNKYDIHLEKEHIHTTMNNIQFISSGKNQSFIKLQNRSIYTSEKVHVNTDRKHNKTITIFNRNLYKLSSIWYNDQKENIIEIDCGLKHSLLLSDSGRVYSMGNNDYGQCGLGGNMVNQFILKPKLIKEFVEMAYDIKSISCGDFSSCCIDRHKQYLWCFGATKAYLKPGSITRYNQYYSKPNIYLLSMMNNAGINVIKVKCGGFTTVALDDKGYVYVLGQMMRGRALLTRNVKFRDFDIGNDHIILIGQDNEIYNFDGNDHNNNINHHNHNQYRYGNMQQLDRNLFPDLKPESNVHSVIAAANSTIVIFN